MHIQNLAGFTGMYSQHDGSKADMNLSGGAFTISGSAEGYKTDKPSEPDDSGFQDHRQVLTGETR